jgi:tripartite-type tricarboxylate transporter receptor subunit TctC
MRHSALQVRFDKQHEIRGRLGEGGTRLDFEPGQFGLLISSGRGAGGKMKNGRRQFLKVSAGVAAFPIASRFAVADDYPSRPIHFIVGFAGGSGLDITARLIGQAMSDNLGQPVVIENRPGAATNIATEAVVNAPPDGYTILMVSTAAYTNGALYPHLNFDFIRDIAPVASATRGGCVLLVNPAFTAKTILEFVAYGKANPGKITVGAIGTGTVTHVAAEMFRIMTGIETTHVAYRGEPEALTDLMAGNVQATVTTLIGAVEFIKDGKLHALGVTTAQRFDILPDIPAIGEFVPGYEANLWNGVGAPRATPPEIISKLNAAINAGLKDPKTKTLFAKLGTVTVPTTPAEYGKVIVDETGRWSKVIRAAGIRAE